MSPCLNLGSTLNLVGGKHQKIQNGDRRSQHSSASCREDKAGEHPTVGMCPRGEWSAARKDAPSRGAWGTWSLRIKVSHPHAPAWAKLPWGREVIPPLGNTSAPVAGWMHGKRGVSAVSVKVPCGGSAPHSASDSKGREQALRQALVHGRPGTVASGGSNGHPSAAARQTSCGPSAPQTVVWPGKEALTPVVTRRNSDRMMLGGKSDATTMMQETVGTNHPGG